MIDRTIIDGGIIDFIIFIVVCIIVYFYYKNTDNKKMIDKFNQNATLIENSRNHGFLPNTSPKQGKTILIIIIVVIIALIGGGLIFG
jgi:amino acid permease